MKNYNTIRTEVNALYCSKIISWFSEMVKENRKAPQSFPLRIYLDAPVKPEDVLNNKEEFLAFCKEWSQNLKAGHIDALEKDIKGLGKIKVPIHIVFDSPEDLAMWSGHIVEYQSSMQRLHIIANKLPDLLDSALNLISAISNLQESDFIRFLEVCEWILANHETPSFIRKVNIKGVDTKWFEAYRKLIIDFLRDKLHLSPIRKDLRQLGFMPPPLLVRMVVLDHVLRSKTGGVRYLGVSIQELENLPLKPHRIIFLDSLETALSMPDIPGCIVMLTPYNMFHDVCSISWVANAKCIYIGNIDIRSFISLHNLRVYLPKIDSAMMDEDTFLKYQDIWSYDDIMPFEGALSVDTLTLSEAHMYRTLIEGQFGDRVRLVQEKIPMSDILEALNVKEVEE